MVVVIVQKICLSVAELEWVFICYQSIKGQGHLLSIGTRRTVQLFFLDEYILKMCKLGATCRPRGWVKVIAKSKNCFLLNK